MLEDNRQTGVYRIRCTTNQKVYIGSAASSFKQRWEEHERDLRKNRHHSKRLQNAWNKYGPLYFVFEIVERTDPRFAVAVEQTFLDFWKAADKRFGFNIRPTADSALGMKRSAASKKKIADALRGKTHTEERKRNIGAARKGFKASVETKQKMSIARRGMVKSQATRDKISAAQKGRPFTETHRANVAKANRNLSEEAKAAKNAKISAANSNPSPETREKMSAWQRGRIMSDESKAKMSASQRGRKHSPETIEKMRASAIRRHAAKAAALAAQQETPNANP